MLQVSPPSWEMSSPPQSPPFETIQSYPISLEVAPPHPASTVMPMLCIAEMEVHATGWPSSRCVQCTLSASKSAVFHTPPLAVARSHAEVPPLEDGTGAMACAAPEEAKLPLAILCVVDMST